MTGTRIAVIPAYEPDEKLVQTAEEAAAAGFQVIVVDDGSGAAYRDCFQRTGNIAHVISYGENKGKGYAMKTAFRYIDTSYRGAYTVVVLDSDGQHRVSDALLLCKAAEESRGTLFLGSRKQSGKSPLRSRIGNGITRNVFRIISGVSVYDTQTGMRAFSSGLMEQVLAVNGDRYEYEMNQLMDFAEEGIPIREIPIETIYIDNNRGSHFHTLKDSFRIYRQIFRFSASSFISFLLDFSIFSCIVALFGSGAAVFANIFARLISASANYGINRSFVFQSNETTARSAGKYVLLAAGILGTNTLILYLLTGVLGFNPYFGKLLTEAMMAVVSFIMQKRFVFCSGSGKKHSQERAYAA